jgi:predicted Zn-dependent peptidase
VKRIGALVTALVANAAVAGEPTIPHERYTLDNGLTVVLAQDRSAPIVHTHIWYHVGSKDEVQGRTGFAHLFEHLMFQGSLNAPGEYFTPFQEVGGDLNGTTNVDRTNYYETVPSQFLPLALFMESDRMGNLLDTLDISKLDNQREVVRNERRQRYENRPYGEWLVHLMANTYPKGHPYHHATIGSHEDLEAATLDDVRTFFETWYVPNNATLTVVGDFEVATAKALIEENFGWIPRGADPVRREVETPPLTEDVVFVSKEEVPEQRVWMAWHSPALLAPGDAELDIAASVLCAGKDSRMYQDLVLERGIARDLACFQLSRHLTSVFIVQGTAADGHTTEELAAEVSGYFDTVAAEAPVDEADIAAAVTAYEVGFYQRIQTISGKGNTLSSYLFHAGNSDYIGADLKRYLQIKPAAVKSTLETYLQAPHVEVHILPEGGE